MVSDDRPGLVDALIHYGVDASPSRVEQLVRCANPDHDETRPSMSVNSIKGLFSCKACGFAGDVYTLIARLEGTTDFAATLEAARRLFGAAGPGQPARRGRVGISGEPRATRGGDRPGFRVGIRRRP